MVDKKNNTADLRKKILLGIERAFEKLIIQKKKIDGSVVVSKDGKIITVKASSLM